MAAVQKISGGMKSSMRCAVAGAQAPALPWGPPRSRCALALRPYCVQRPAAVHAAVKKALARSGDRTSV
jgi:hypothetical protein